MENQGLRNSQIVFALGHQNDSHGRTHPRNTRQGADLLRSFHNLHGRFNVFSNACQHCRETFMVLIAKKNVIEDRGTREKSKWTLVSNLSFLSELLFTFTHSERKG